MKPKTDNVSNKALPLGGKTLVANVEFRPIIEGPKITPPWLKKIIRTYIRHEYSYNLITKPHQAFKVFTYKDLRNNGGLAKGLEDEVEGASENGDEGKLQQQQWDREGKRVISKP